MFKKNSWTSSTWRSCKQHVSFIDQMSNRPSFDPYQLQKQVVPYDACLMIDHDQKLPKNKVVTLRLMCWSMGSRPSWDIGRLWPYSLFLRFEVKKIGSQVTKCAWSPTPVTQKWCVPFVVACDPIRARSIIFEGSLAEKLRFWVSQLHFWRKSRRKASF